MAEAQRTTAGDVEREPTSSTSRSGFFKIPPRPVSQVAAAGALTFDEVPPTVAPLSNQEFAAAEEALRKSYGPLVAVALGVVALTVVALWAMGYVVTQKRTLTIESDVPHLSTWK